MQTVGLLTGTFDPVHLGHIELAKAAMKACGLDEVWLLVNAEPEHKNGTASYRDRLVMAKLAVEGEPRVKVYEGPLHDRPHNIETFIELMSNYPSDRFLFIVGMDTISRLDRWPARESVVRNASYAVAHRPGSAVTEIEQLRDRLGALGVELRVSLFDFEDHGAASSTEVRSKTRAGERPESLDARVYEYILANGLYRRPSHSA